MSIIDLYLAELSRTWGYETEELNDIRDKMEELGNSCFWEGYMERSEELKNEDFKNLQTPNGFYAKKSDMSDYE